MAPTGKSNGLGFGNGSLIDYGEGVVEYRKTATILPAFKVQVADIAGFTTRRPTPEDKKRLNASSFERIFTIQGSGTTLAEVAVNVGASEKIEAWFRAHPMFGAAASSVQSAPADATPAPGIGDQLMKLVQLRDAGALTDTEFEQAKAKLLA